MLQDAVDRFRPSLRRIKNCRLRFRSAVLRTFTDVQCHPFRCNICGKDSISPLAEITGRETPSCYHCGSTLRFRSIVGALSKELFGEILPIPDLPASTSIVGIGMSDTDVYAVPLSKKFSYRNTFYHKEPRLDITSINEQMHGTADFVISSDVFEHVPPPVDRAFGNLLNILKRDGVCIFSVPYRKNGETREHYPELFEYRVVKRKGQRVLLNKTRDGTEQVFRNLRFHGGGGSTLEMRSFSESSLLEHIARAGFTDTKVHREDCPQYGIIHGTEESLVISMRRGPGGG